MNRISGLLRILAIWIFITVIQIFVLVKTNTNLTKSIVLISVFSIVFGLIAYFQDKGLKKIEIESQQFKKKLDDMFNFDKQ